VCYSTFVPKFLRYSTSKNVVTLKTGLGVRRGHWKCHHSMERIWLPIAVLVTMALTYVVTGLFNVEKYHYLEIRVTDQSMSLKMVLFDRLHGYGFLIVFYSDVPKTDLQLQKCPGLENPFRDPSTSLKMSPFDGKHYGFLLTFRSNHGPISYRFRARRRFQLKIENISYSPCILHPLMRFPWNWVPTRDSSHKTRMTGLLGRPRSLMISSFVLKAPTWQTYRQTDGRTDTRRQQRPRLRIALLGKYFWETILK